MSPVFRAPRVFKRLVLWMAKKKSKRQLDSSAVSVDVEKRVPLSYSMPEQISAAYANQLLVQTDELATYLSFFQAQPPILLGASADEVQKKIEALGEVKATLVAQVAVANDRLPVFAEVLMRVVSRLRERAEAASQPEHSDSKP